MPFFQYIVFTMKSSNLKDIMSVANPGKKKKIKWTTKIN